MKGFSQSTRIRPKIARHTQTPSTSPATKTIMIISLMIASLIHRKSNSISRIRLQTSMMPRIIRRNQVQRKRRILPQNPIIIRRWSRAPQIITNLRKKLQSNPYSKRLPRSKWENSWTKWWLTTTRKVSRRIKLCRSRPPSCLHPNNQEKL